jgi:putative ABC transport system permease protein
MGIPMRAGRTLSEGDRKRKVTLISERLASELWPKQDPIGRRLVRGDREGFEVIGVVGDVRAEAHKAPVAMMYRPYWEWMPFRTVLVARAAADPLSIAGTVRSSIRSGDADVPVPRMRTMSEVLDESLAARRFQMMLVGVFAVTALLVASMGIYAVVAYSVARRTAEIGIRAALGAGVAGIYGLVLRQGMAPVVAGLAFGIAGTLAFDRLIGSLLYDVRGFDPLTIVVVTGILAAVGLAACMVPARRAARVDPLRALHYE